MKQRFHALQGSPTFRKVLRHGAEGCTSPLKEVVLRIFIALKNTSSSAAFVPANLGSNGKHDYHYTTENDELILSAKLKMKKKILKTRPTVPCTLQEAQVKLYMNF
jgi:hypothetical protein